jgi:hypothetical protein
VNGIQGLLRAELRRFFSRRVMRGAFAFGIALSTVVLVILTVRSDITKGSETHEMFECASPTVPPGGQGTLGTVPSSSDCVLQQTTATVTHDRRVNVHDNLSDTIEGTGIAMVFVAFVIGASFIGAEFAAASVGAQLVFEPRRARVVAVKGLAVGIGLAILSIALLLYIAILQGAASSLRGVFEGIDGAWVADRAGDMGRAAAAVALAGIAAYAITVVTRRTVAAVAGLLVVGWVSAIIGSLDNWRWVAKYNPTSAFIAMVVNETQRTTSDSQVLTVRAATVSSIVWAVALTVVAAAIFARREVR